MAAFFAYHMADRDLCAHKLCLAGKVQELSGLCQAHMLWLGADAREMLAPLIYELQCLETLSARFVEEEAEKEIISEAENRKPEFRWSEMAVQDLLYCPADAQERATKITMLMKNNLESTPEQLKHVACASIDVASDLLWRLESLIGWGEAGVYAVEFQTLLVE